MTDENLEFKIHNTETAPEKSKNLLEKSKSEFGYIPNLHGALAESPSILEAYQNLHKLFANSSFDNEELTVVWQSINVEHKCHYCIPAHTAIAKAMKVSDSITTALRNKTELPSTKLEALRSMTLSIVKNRGNVSHEEIQQFFEAGYSQENLLDIILGVAQKTISNYTNHIANTPIDSIFEKYKWNE